MEIKFDHVSLALNYKTPLEKTILNDVSFDIRVPGIYCFIGAQNSGKSAVGDLINALIAPTKGTVTIGKFKNDGSVIHNVNKLRYDTGYVFKNPYDMFLNKTVKEELEFGLKYFRYKTDKMSMRTIDALKLVGLDETYLKLDPLRLTLVDAKKVALACALIYNPNILILDEFTTGLSYSDKEDLLRLIRILKTKYKKTIIVLSKDTSFCYKIADYVYLMHLTKIVKEGEKNILTDSNTLKEIGLEVPKIVTFVEECNKKGHRIDYYNNILDLIKGVYRDVF